MVSVVIRDVIDRVSSMSSVVIRDVIVHVSSLVENLFILEQRNVVADVSFLDVSSPNQLLLA